MSFESPDFCASRDKLKREQQEKADVIMESCECAMTVHHGGYSTLSEAYGAVVNWIMENGYEIAGAPFDLYIKTQFESLSPEDWETEVYLLTIYRYKVWYR